MSYIRRLQRRIGGPGAGLVSSIPAVVNQTLSFGALTLEDAGGVTPANTGGAITSATIDSGDASNHFDISSAGEITPTATGAGSLSGPYTLGCTFTGADGSVSATITVNTVANKFSCKPVLAELSAAWTAATASTALGILIRDGSNTSTARWEPSGAKAFTNEFVIEPHAWTEDSTPRLSTRGVTLPGFLLPASCENVTFQGLNFTQNRDGGVLIETSAICEVTKPSTNFRFRQNRVYSDDLLTKLLAGDLVTDGVQYGGIRGFKADGDNTDPHEYIRVEDNYFHDITRGVVGAGWQDDGVNNSRFCGNEIYDAYTHFSTFGGQTNGLDFFDNRFQHTWSSVDDNGGPHPSIGFAFDSPSTLGFLNVNVMGNIADVGWHRAHYEVLNGITPSRNGSTGAKFNDPQMTNAYNGIVFMFNLLICHGIGREYSAAINVDDRFNTTINEDYLSSVNGEANLQASYYMNGAANVKMDHNLSAAFEIGSEDNSTVSGVVYPETEASLSAYSNLEYDSVTFTGHPTKGFTKLEIDELEAAYTPAAGQYALTAKIGALGTGYYSGNGVHTAPAHAKPAASAGTAHNAVTTVWDGSTYATRTGSLGLSDGPELTIAFEAELDASLDSSEVVIYHTTQSIIELKKGTDGSLQIRLKDTDFVQILIATTTPNFWTSSDGMAKISVHVNMDDGRAVFAKNGTPSITPADISTFVAGDIGFGDIGLNRIMANFSGAKVFQGNFRQLLLTDTFIEPETNTGLNKLYVASGAFNDWDDDGSNINSVTEPVVFRGDAATINGGTANGGDGGAFSIAGGTVAADYTPLLVEFETTDYGQSDFGLTAAAEFAGAFVWERTLANGSGLESALMAEGTTNTHILLVDGGDDIQFRIESSSGLAKVATISSVSADPGDRIACFFKFRHNGDTTGDYEIWINGTNNTGSFTGWNNTTMKPPVYLFNTDGAGTTWTEDQRLYGGLWLAMKSGAYALQASDFFDTGTNEPTFNDATIDSVAADFFQNGNAAAWAADTDADLAGTPVDVT